MKNLLADLPKLNSYDQSYISSFFGFKEELVPFLEREMVKAALQKHIKICDEVHIYTYARVVLARLK